MIEDVVTGGIATQASGNLVHWINNVEQKAQAIIASIPFLDDEVLQQVHDAAENMGHWSWKIQAAARNEILKRAAKYPAGRGRRDVDEEGRQAIARKLAPQLHVHPKTILEDSSIYSTFFEGDRSATAQSDGGGYEHLPEKDYYRAAIRTEDPHATLEYFAEQKAKDPTYSTRDAWRYLKEMKTEPLDSPVQPLIEDAVVRDWYQRFADVVNSAPAHKGLRHLLSDFLDEVRHYVQRPTPTRREQLLDLIEQGIDEQDQIAQEIGVDRVHVAVWLNRMVEDDVLERFEKEQREGARGQRRTGYRIVKRSE